jgi:hypothetical protein
VELTSWAWLILPLGVCRATQIALWDRVLRRPRSWLLRKLNPRGVPMSDPTRPYLSYLLECPWCLSVWVAAAAVAATLYEPTRQATLGVLLALALSLVAVALDRTFDRLLPDQPLSDDTPSYVSSAFAELSDDETR